MTGLSIGEVARRTGLRASALRYYDESGLLPAPMRLKGRRVHDAQVIRRIDGLRFAQEAGFTLKEIRTLFQGSGVRSTLSSRWQSMAKKKLVELDVLAAAISLALFHRSRRRSGWNGNYRLGRLANLDVVAAPVRSIHFPQRIDGFLLTGLTGGVCEAKTHAGHRAKNDGGFVVTGEKECYQCKNDYAYRQTKSHSSSNPLVSHGSHQFFAASVSAGCNGRIQSLRSINQ